ncbi:MAG: chemotaxis protein CheC [Planctomycetota bacterium]
MRLDEDDIDALGEIVNIGVGRAAGSLSELIGSRIELRVPQVRVVDHSDVDQQYLNDNGIAVVQSFEGDVSGNAVLLFPSASGKKLAMLLGGYETEDLPEIELTGILSEVGNIVLNGVLGSLANAIETDLSYQVPNLFVDDSFSALMAKSGDQDPDRQGLVVLADAEFSVDTMDICGSVIIAFRLGALGNLLTQLKQLYV